MLSTMIAIRTARVSPSRPRGHNNDGYRGGRTGEVRPVALGQNKLAVASHCRALSFWVVVNRWFLAIRRQAVMGRRLGFNFL